MKTNVPICTNVPKAAILDFQNGRRQKSVFRDISTHGQPRVMISRPIPTFLGPRNHLRSFTMVYRHPKIPCDAF